MVEEQQEAGDDKQAKLEAIGFAWVAPGYNLTSRKRRKGGEDENEEDDEEEEEEELEEPAPFPPAQHFQPDFFPAAQGQRRWF